MPSLNFIPLYIILAFVAIIFFLIVISSASLKVDKIAIPSTIDIRILQVSDIHYPFTWISSRRLKRQVSRISPDIIVITGDIINNSSKITNSLKYIKFFSSGIPTYMCVGNHDYSSFGCTPEGERIFVNQVNNNGIFCTDNGSFISRPKGDGTAFNIIMLNDLRAGQTIEEMTRNINIDNKLPSVILCHNPDTALEYTEYANKHTDAVRPLAILTGHFHGGQISMFGIEFSILRKERIIKLNHKRGLKSHNGIPIYINDGIGNSLLPFRFLVPPRITVISI